MAAPVCRDMDPLCVLSALGREDTRDRQPSLLKRQEEHGEQGYAGPENCVQVALLSQAGCSPTGPPNPTLLAPHDKGMLELE